MPFTLIDDGTLDTVVRCDDCGQHLHSDSAMLLESTYRQRRRDHSQRSQDRKRYDASGGA